MRSLALHLTFIVLTILSLAYVEKLRKESKISVKEKGIARDVTIKVFGEGGEEWKVGGENLVTFGKEIYMIRVELRSKSGYVVRAGSIKFLRDQKLGTLKGGVDLRGDALFIKTESAIIDLNKNLVSGDSKVMIWRNRNYIEGLGFKAYLKPLRVIISNVRTKHEI